MDSSWGVVPNPPTPRAFYLDAAGTSSLPESVLLCSRQAESAYLLGDCCTDMVKAFLAILEDLTKECFIIKINYRGTLLNRRREP